MSNSEGCIAGLSAFLSSLCGSNPSSSSRPEISTLVSALPAPFAQPPKKAKTNSRVSGKSRLKPDQNSDVNKDLGLENKVQGNSEVSTFFQEDYFLTLLEKLIGHTKQLQNSKTSGLVPREELAANEVCLALKPYATSYGGPLKIEVLQYVAKRPNVKITLPAKVATKRTVGLIGAHMDVVPANPEEWKKNPFSLTREGDKLFGRGTTDCLGHVALITTLLAFLAEQHKSDNLSLNFNLVAVFIAAEEGGEFGVGIDMMEKAGALEELKPSIEQDPKTNMPLKGGPVYWIDSADSQPCCGTNGVAQWELKSTGRVFHSGLPHKGINAIELAMEALAEIQENFYKDFGESEEQKAYGFAVGSSMKPTQINCCVGSLNQIPPWCKVSGDVRLVPFYDLVECMERVEGYVKTINENLGKLRSRGPYSKYDLAGEGMTGPDSKGILELSWSQPKEKAMLYEGIACDLSSAGHKALVQATAEVLPECKPYSVSGSLPLVRMLQKAGFDLQIDGFGLLSTYHAVDEYCLLSDMKKSHEILLRVLSLLN